MPISQTISKETHKNVMDNFRKGLNINEVSDTLNLSLEIILLVLEKDFYNSMPDRPYKNNAMKEADSAIKAKMFLAFKTALLNAANNK